MTCRTHQTVSLDRNARVLGLRPQREADHNESNTEQRADDGDAPVGVPVAWKKDGAEKGIMANCCLRKSFLAKAFLACRCRTPTPRRSKRNAIGLLT
ncbi:hypothetical protein [Bradyrhizobium yuanmingense]|uniref:hypothetical protein n=1 Tax=Bradyrhizobium yuanmingense TaxID=108015 RepID=UPI0018DF6851|nr:hypothetical protein [Bradyrhizobium yuanmingense]